MAPLLEKWLWLPMILIGLLLVCSLDTAPLRGLAAAPVVVGMILFLRLYYKGVPRA
jgi:hypothetical protein